jgi:putative serine protease PepD
MNDPFDRMGSQGGDDTPRTPWSPWVPVAAVDVLEPAGGQAANGTDPGYRPLAAPMAGGPGRPLPPPSPAKPGKSPYRAGVVGGIVGALLASGLTFGLVKATDNDKPTTAAVKSQLVTTPNTVASGSNGAGTGSSGTGSGGSSGQLAGPALDIHALLAKVEPSVVAIEIGSQGRNGNVQAVAAGSGVVVSSDGLIVTNAHVVNVTDQFGRQIPNPVITIRLQDGSSRAATVLGSSAADDIALVKVTDTSQLVPIELGDSDALQVGDDVVAIGNALDLGATPTVTKGIVSAKNRTLDIDATLTLKGLLQIDAAINHGNSGGALVNASGQLVGINSAGITDAQNVGFAIAVNTIKPLIDQLKTGSTTKPAVASLGVNVVDGTDGATIVGVTTGSGAEAAGIQVNDVVTKIDDKVIATKTDLGNAIKAHKPGDTIKIELSRGGKISTVQATLGSRQGS